MTFIDAVELSKYDRYFVITFFKNFDLNVFLRLSVKTFIWQSFSMKIIFSVANLIIHS